MSYLLVPAYVVLRALFIAEEFAKSTSMAYAFVRSLQSLYLVLGEVYTRRKGGFEVILNNERSLFVGVVMWVDANTISLESCIPCLLVPLMRSHVTIVLLK
jgi:hypothetical protein